MRIFHYFSKRFWRGKSRVQPNAWWISWKVRENIYRKKVIHFRTICRFWNCFWVFHATSKKCVQGSDLWVPALKFRHFGATQKCEQNSAPMSVDAFGGKRNGDRIRNSGAVLFSIYMYLHWNSRVFMIFRLYPSHTARLLLVLVDCIRIVWRFVIQFDLRTRNCSRGQVAVRGRWVKRTMKK